MTDKNNSGIVNEEAWEIGMMILLLTTLVLCPAYLIIAAPEAAKLIGWMAAGSLAFILMITVVPLAIGKAALRVKKRFDLEA